MDVLLNQKIAEISALMQSQLRIRGKSLHVQMRRAGRLLPRGVRRDIGFLLEAAALGQNPKLARMINPEKVAQAHRNAVSFLQGVDPVEQRKTAILRFLAAVAFPLIVLFALVLYVLVQRGLV